MKLWYRPAEAASSSGLAAIQIWRVFRHRYAAPTASSSASMNVSVSWMKPVFALMIAWLEVITPAMSSVARLPVTRDMGKAQRYKAEAVHDQQKRQRIQHGPPGLTAHGDNKFIHRHLLQFNLLHCAKRRGVLRPRRILPPWQK